MPHARYLIGDVRRRIKDIAPGSVDLGWTSPPFLNLRSYLPGDHPEKDAEIGSEGTPAEFLTVMLERTAEWAEVLAPHGSLCIEFGDTYAGSGGAGGDYDEDGLRAGQQEWSGSARAAAKIGKTDVRPTRSGRRSRADDEADGILAPRPRPGPGGRDEIEGWPLDKSLCMIPELYRVALAYGINPLTGEVSPAGRWRIRNVVRWVRPNPPVGALGDKFRPATSEIVIATRSTDRWFDGFAVRVAASEGTNPRTAKGVARRENNTKASPDGNRATLELQHTSGATAPLLDWWKISPSGYKGSHFATFPTELCVPIIESMCPRRVCTLCGEPSRRIIRQDPTGQNTRRGEPDDDRQLDDLLRRARGVGRNVDRVDRLRV